jgi:hypothetical protein
MEDRTRQKRLLRRLSDYMSRRKREPVIDNRITAADIRRGEELIEKYGLDFLREEDDRR